jgi:hypothetical protein
MFIEVSDFNLKNLQKKIKKARKLKARKLKARKLAVHNLNNIRCNCRNNGT